MYSLTEEQVARFQRDGFLVIRAAEHGLFPPSQVYDWAYEVKGWPKENGKWMPYDEINIKGERQLLRTENFANFHAGFDGLLRENSLPAMLQQLSGSQMLLFKDKINYKAANGNGFGAHIDAPGYDHICKVEHLTINIAIDDATPANGCIEVVVGSHKMQVPLIGQDIYSKWIDAAEWTPVPLASGDLLIFGSHLAHRSAANRTHGSRASVYATYSSILDGDNLHAEYYAHRRQEFPPDHERIRGKDYSEGYKTYAFAAPFVKQVRV